MNPFFTLQVTLVQAAGLAAKEFVQQEKFIYVTLNVQLERLI